MSTGKFRTAPWLLLLWSVCSVLHSGCKSAAAPAAPPGGGQVPMLSFTEFESTVEPILVRQGCDAGGDCHGGGIRGTFQLSPAGAKNAHFDFAQASLQVSVSSPASSPLLTKPLALQAGGTPHSYKPLATTADPDYQAILRWILDGVAS